MKLGVSAFAWAGKMDRSLLDLLPALKDLGLDVFELPMFDPATLPVADIRRAFEDSGMECSICAILPRGINPIDTDREVRSKSLEHLKNCVKSTAELGAKLLGGPLYAPIGYLPEHRPTMEEWQWAIETFQVVGEMLDGYDITLSIEPVNRSETFFVRTATEAVALCDAVGHRRMGITIDTFHANIEEQKIAAAVVSAGHRLKHMHMSENDRGILGEGHVNFSEILEALRNIGYSGCLMLEGFGYMEGVKDAPGALWANMSTDPMKFASSGVSYLRSLLDSRSG